MIRCTDISPIHSEIPPSLLSKRSCLQLNNVVANQSDKDERVNDPPQYGPWMQVPSRGRKGKPGNFKMASKVQLNVNMGSRFHMLNKENRETENLCLNSEVMGDEVEKVVLKNFRNSNKRDLYYGRIMGKLLYLLGVVRGRGKIKERQ